jgi:2-dehydro-3-deoxyphosphogluconate aldolase/(4S)-4-hydroxy-2-oxoglutarate aldolase
LDNIIEKIRSIGIIPVVSIDDADRAEGLAQALIDGGIPCAEVTFRTEQGAEALRRIAKAFPDVLLGAGTVLSIEQAETALKSGAKFAVSPGFNSKIVSYCQKIGLPIYPGCSNPTDMEAALEMGLSTVKFFPAEQSGGVPFLKAVSAPYSNLTFIPTGGINENNLKAYLGFKKIVACGGSWMVPPKLISEGRFEEIREKCQIAIKQMLGFRLCHIGINAESQKNALEAANLFKLIFGFDVDQGARSSFVSSEIEIMHQPYLGKYGHIAIETSSIIRAIRYLKSKGVEFNQETSKEKSIYLRDEIAGFAVHLLEK